MKRTFLQPLDSNRKNQNYYQLKPVFDCGTAGSMQEAGRTN